VVGNASAGGRCAVDAERGNGQSSPVGVVHVDGGCRGEDGGTAGSRTSLEEVAEDGIPDRPAASAIHCVVGGGVVGRHVDDVGEPSEDWKTPGTTVFKASAGSAFRCSGQIGGYKSKLFSLQMAGWEDVGRCFVEDGREWFEDQSAVKRSLWGDLYRGTGHRDHRPSTRRAERQGGATSVVACTS
jgi:hypothetical protein